MQLHELQNKKTKKKRIGRGDKTSGRGTKGQKSRAGHKMQPVIRQFIKRYHKLRGYRNKSHSSVMVTNVGQLNKFPAGSTVTPAEIEVEKILGQGEIAKVIHLKGFIVSASAKEKIEKAGGSVE
jgi:large subunit ribosomal protein L15